METSIKFDTDIHELKRYILDLRNKLNDQIKYIELPDLQIRTCMIQETADKLSRNIENDINKIAQEFKEDFETKPFIERVRTKKRFKSKLLNKAFQIVSRVNQEQTKMEITLYTSKNEQIEDHIIVPIDIVHDYTIKPVFGKTLYISCRARDAYIDHLYKDKMIEEVIEKASRYVLELDTAIKLGCKTISVHERSAPFMLVSEMEKYT